jgi:signal transduction histidine kinase
VPEDLKSLSIYSDYDLIRKVLHHLTGNSLKFTVQGSISLGLNRKENAVSIFVQDTGIGIAENAQKYVFDSFMQEDFSSTRLYEGSGLGLSIVNGIVKLLGGEITLASTKGKGTLFSFTVPINSR